MAIKCCTNLETAKKRCPIVFQGHPSNFKVTRNKTSPILTQIGRFRTIGRSQGRSQLSNPSDLPCLTSVSIYMHNKFAVNVFNLSGTAPYMFWESWLEYRAPCWCAAHGVTEPPAGILFTTQNTFVKTLQVCYVANFTNPQAGMLYQRQTYILDLQTMLSITRVNEMIIFVNIMLRWFFCTKK